MNSNDARQLVIDRALNWDQSQNGRYYFDSPTIEDQSIDYPIDWFILKYPLKAMEHG